MSSEQPKQPEVTPKGAVEVDEKDLDQAAGGTESFSLNYSKIEHVGQKVTPQTIVSAGPGAGPHIAPEKKR